VKTERKLIDGYPLEWLYMDDAKWLSMNEHEQREFWRTPMPGWRVREIMQELRSRENQNRTSVLN
jgi:hypothetical protein